MSVKRNIEERSCNHCWSGKAISIVCCEWVFVALGIQHVMHVSHIIISTLSGSTIIFHIISQRGTIFKTTILSTKCVFLFCLQLLSETFLILRTIKQHMIKNVYRFSCKVPLLFLSDFNKTWIFSTNFRKILKYQISWNSFQREPNSSMRTDIRTDRHDETNKRFSQFYERA